MRLAVLMSMASPWSRGIALSLAGLGHEVHILHLAGDAHAEAYLREDDAFQAESITAFRRGVTGVHAVPTRVGSGLRYLVDARRLGRQTRAVGVDALLTLYGGGFAAMAWLSGFRPYAVYAVGSDILLQTGARRRIARPALASAATVFANGAYLAERTRALSPCAHVEPLLIGVDTDRFVPGDPAVEPVRVVCTRWFSPIYNNGYLVDALALLPEHVPEFRVTFVSKGPQLDQVRSLADRLLPPRRRAQVEFLGGVDDNRLLTELRRSHVYVSLSRSDGTSTSLLEALACGLYPVISDLPQNREWVAPCGEDGILVPLDRPAVLAAALARAISDADLRRRVAERLRRRVEERGSTRKNMARLAIALEALARGGAGSFHDA